jgi:hypothetical protein
MWIKKYKADNFKKFEPVEKVLIFYVFQVQKHCRLFGEPGSSPRFLINKN